jgi:hypothetical protein
MTVVMTSPDAVGVAVTEGVTVAKEVMVLDPAPFPVVSYWPVDWAPVDSERLGLVTGTTVVETGMVDVTTVVDLAGQSVTVAAQLITVISLVI